MTEEDRPYSIYDDYAERLRRRRRAEKQEVRQDILQAAKKVIAKRFDRCGPECIMSISAITNLTRKQLDVDGLDSHWKGVPKIVEELILETFSTHMWEDGPLGRRKYAVKAKAKSKKDG